jgi:hypothetical protein
MASISRRRIDSIMALGKPGFRVIHVEAKVSPQGDAPGPAIDRTPDLAELRRRYLGDSAADFAEIADSGPEADTADAGVVPDDSDAHVVVIAPADRGQDAFSHGPGPKTVVVSGKDGTILAEQG